LNDLQGDAAGQSIKQGCQESSLLYRNVRAFYHRYLGESKLRIIKVASVLVYICESNINIFYFMLKLNFIHFPKGWGAHNTKQWYKIWNI